jgi:hypothetical protein
MLVSTLLSREERSMEPSDFLDQAREVEGTSEADLFLAISEKESEKLRREENAKGFRREKA